MSKATTHASIRPKRSPELFSRLDDDVSGSDNEGQNTRKSSSMKKLTAAAAVFMVAFARRSERMLAMAMTCAMFVQPAMIVACGLAFVSIWLFDQERQYARAFAVTAAAIVIWRLTHGYPDNAWFLGWPHAALLTAAAVALALRPRWYALPLAFAVMLPFAPSLFEGAHFLHGDAWLNSIVEFQP